MCACISLSVKLQIWVSGYRSGVDSCDRGLGTCVVCGELKGAVVVEEGSAVYIGVMAVGSKGHVMASMNGTSWQKQRFYIIYTYTRTHTHTYPQRHVPMYICTFNYSHVIIRSFSPMIFRVAIRRMRFPLTRGRGMAAPRKSRASLPFSGGASRRSRCSCDSLQLSIWTTRVCCMDSTN